MFNLKKKFKHKSFADCVRIHKIVLFEKSDCKNKHKSITLFQTLHGIPVHELKPLKVHVFIIFFYFQKLFYFLGRQMSYEAQIYSKIIS